ncbi:hypothetical protein BpHYR1_022329 [Brachionus plicatilis]|uniref:Uncharacterized protein n=1 Tax=Brachionus plicatilis TaxID=10195 RepID=A0A3M7PL46_BRAPC|nr:hypothetical protein BpHYR1_022329 [Brachionus plicatilis]
MKCLHSSYKLTAKKTKNSQQLISTIDDFDFYINYPKNGSIFLKYNLKRQVKTTQLIQFYSLSESLFESELEFESGEPRVNQIEIDIIYRFLDLICMIIIIYHIN